MLEAQTELTKRFIEAFCKGETINPASIQLEIVDFAYGDSVKFRVTINDKHGNELVKFVSGALAPKETLTICELDRAFTIEVRS